MYYSSWSNYNSALIESISLHHFCMHFVYILSVFLVNLACILRILCIYFAHIQPNFTLCVFCIHFAYILRIFYHCFTWCSTVCSVWFVFLWYAVCLLFASILHSFNTNIFKWYKLKLLLKHKQVLNECKIYTNSSQTAYQINTNHTLHTVEHQVKQW